MNVSFDFDGTLHRDGRPLWPAKGMLRWHHDAGHCVSIATTRTESHERPSWWRIHEPSRVLVHGFIKRYRLAGHSLREARQVALAAAGRQVAELGISAIRGDSRIYAFRSSVMLPLRKGT